MHNSGAAQLKLHYVWGRTFTVHLGAEVVRCLGLDVQHVTCFAGTNCSKSRTAKLRCLANLPCYSTVSV
jgi:hypothetical protein